MQIEEALDTLNSKFEYKSDTFRWLDHWRVMVNDGDVWHGDCEDYSLTLAWLVSDMSLVKFIWNLVTFRFLLWFVKSPGGEGHAIIKIDGLYYDNIQKKGCSKDQLKAKGYKFVFPLIFPAVALKFAISLVGGLVIRK
jgi:predicted transglutaminase-like cysteine proteinase